MKIWMVLFSIWGAFLTGVASPITGTPGILQAVRLRSLLEMKQAKQAALEKEVEQFQIETERLERLPVVQEREIRKTLGYVSPDEIIFDFSASERRSTLN